MKLSINVKVAIILVDLCAIPAVFAKPPPEVVELGRDAEEIHRGVCRTERHDAAPCIVGQKPDGTMLILVFARSGLLVEVIHVIDGKEKVVWHRDST